MNIENNGFTFEKLSVYQKSLYFVNNVYEITARLPKEERFVLTEQFRRAAISISLNIAEGCGNSDLDFKRYLKISKGSIRECIAIITLIRLRRYIDLKIEGDLRNQCSELSKMLSGLMKSL
jgi:four helix bundle protein